MENRTFARTMMFIRVALIIGLIIIVYIGSSRIEKLSQDLKQSEQKVSFLKDSMRVTEKAYYKKVYEIQKASDMAKIESNDSLVLQLQKAFDDFRKEVKQSGGSITSLHTESTHTIEKPTVIVYGDTTRTKLPTYMARHSDEWRTLDIVASPDTTKANLVVRDKYNVVLGQESNGWFKKPTLTAMVQSLSPYSEVKNIQASKVTGNPGPKVSVGYHIGFGGQYGLIHKQLDFGPQGGVSINVKF